MCAFQDHCERYDQSFLQTRHHQGTALHAKLRASVLCEGFFGEKLHSRVPCGHITRNFWTCCWTSSTREVTFVTLHKVGCACGRASSHRPSKCRKSLNQLPRKCWTRYCRKFELQRVQACPQNNNSSTNQTARCLEVLSWRLLQRMLALRSVLVIHLDAVPSAIPVHRILLAFNASEIAKELTIVDQECSCDWNLASFSTMRTANQS